RHGDRETAISSRPLEWKEPDELGRSPGGAGVRPVDEDELEPPAGAETPHRRLGQDGLVEDVALERVGGEIVEREPMPGQLLEAARDDDLRRRVDRGWSGRWGKDLRHLDRKSTRLNSSHVSISYAVFCLKK